MNKYATHMHTRDPPPFYHLFDIAALFVLAPRGLLSLLQAYFCVPRCDSFSAAMNTSKPLSLPCDTSVCQ